MICHSRVQPSLFGEERHERAVEIEPNKAGSSAVLLKTYLKHSFYYRSTMYKFLEQTINGYQKRGHISYF